MVSRNRLLFRLCKELLRPLPAASHAARISNQLKTPNIKEMLLGTYPYITCSVF